MKDMKDTKVKEGCERIPLSQRICQALDMPPEILPGLSSVEIHGRSLVKIQGAGAILLYSPEEIRISLRSKGEYVSVKGFSLYCASYNMGAVGVEGRICSVSFEEDKDGKI